MNPLQWDLNRLAGRLSKGKALPNETERVLEYHGVQVKRRRSWAAVALMPVKFVVVLSIFFVSFQHFLDFRLNEKVVCQAVTHTLTAIQGAVGTHANLTAYISADYANYVQCVHRANQYLIPLEYYRNIAYYALTMIAYLTGPLIAFMNLYKIV